MQLWTAKLIRWAARKERGGQGAVTKVPASNATGEPKLPQNNVQCISTSFALAQSHMYFKQFRMKSLITIALLISVVYAAPAPSQSRNEPRLVGSNEILVIGTEKAGGLGLYSLSSKVSQDETKMNPRRNSFHFVTQKGEGGGAPRAFERITSRRLERYSIFW